MMTRGADPFSLSCCWIAGSKVSWSLPSLFSDDGTQPFAVTRIAPAHDIEKDALQFRRDGAALASANHRLLDFPNRRDFHRCPSEERFIRREQIFSAQQTDFDLVAET